MSVRILSERPGGVIGKRPTAGSGIWSLDSIRKYAPLTIPGLQLWLDASDASTLFDSTTGGSIVSADGGVARWEDKSGQSRHFTQEASASRPTRKIASQNGLDVLSFDGTDDFLDLASTLIGTSAAPATLFCAIKFLSFSTFPEVLEIGNYPRPDPEDTSGYQFISYDDGGMYVSNVGANNERFTAAGTLATSTFYAITFQVSGAAFSSSQPKFWRNGVEQSSTRGTGTATPNISASHVARIGANLIAPAGQFFGGDIAELIIYNSAVSDASRKFVEDYMMTKWGVS